ncbi:MAG: hypothetical protein O3A10_07620 [Chloroflexi bacterium]|nr:hypothetical protein [Chloroflexota bacterium]MDA1145737.1 hypothetical protein [Chloroflexota bacterium]
MASPPMEYRTGNDGDLDGMVAVFQAAFPRWPLIDVPVPAREHLAWKMRSHPRVIDGHMLSILDGEVVGAMVQLARDVRIRGETLIAQSTADVALVPRLQGTGLSRLGTPFYMATIAGLFDLSLNTESNHPSLRAIAASRGTSRSIGNPFRRLVLGLTPASAAGIRWHAAGWRGLPHATRDTVRRLPEPRIEIETVQSLDSRLDDLWAETAPAFDLIGVRDAAFLNWRYADPRGGVSLIRIATQGDAVLGYTVLRWAAQDGAVIADMLVHPDRPDVVRDLAIDAARQTRAQGHRSVGCMLPTRHPYRDVLLKLGFVDLGRQTEVKYDGSTRPIEDFAFLEEPGLAAHLTLGDFDYI